MKNSNLQREICEKYNADFFSSPSEKKLGISDDALRGATPINGLRHPPSGETSGWYIWSGKELSKENDFFKPLHIEHIDKYCPKIHKYLGLPPGWRFLLSDGYEDVWFDPTLLKVD